VRGIFSQVVEIAAGNGVWEKGLHASFLCLNMAALLPNLALAREGRACMTGARLAVKQKALWSNLGVLR
jgi:hypothetical protein